MSRILIFLIGLSWSAAGLADPSMEAIIYRSCFKETRLQGSGEVFAAKYCKCFAIKTKGMAKTAINLGEAEIESAILPYAEACAIEAIGDISIPSPSPPPLPIQETKTMRRWHSDGGELWVLAERVNVEMMSEGQREKLSVPSLAAWSAFVEVIARKNIDAKINSEDESRSFLRMVLDSYPALKEIQANHPDLWERALKSDAELRNFPSYMALTTMERFGIINTAAMEWLSEE